MEKSLPAIPAKRYFTIGEVSELCGVKPYVLRYWEQEFTQLKPMKRRGNRRYYQHHEVLLIRRIRELLYEQGFTISGARNRLGEGQHGRGDAARREADEQAAEFDTADAGDMPFAEDEADADAGAATPDRHGLQGTGDDAQAEGSRPRHPDARTDVIAKSGLSPQQLRQELISIRGLLTV
jgi:DNA-binding transcriptional MerR regulator